MHALLERTFLRVDVMTLDLCFDVEASRLMARFLDEHRDRSSALRDSVAAVAMSAAEAVGLIEFKRGIELEQFLEGAFENHKRAVSAGLLADSTRVALRQALPEWYGFLEDRGILEGDRIYYRFYPDSVRTTYQGVDGQLYLDRVSVGVQRRASILAAYFAPDSDLRERLIDSLERDAAALPGTGARCRTLVELPLPEAVH